MFAAPLVKGVDDFFGGAGIPVAGSTDLHGRGAREHELDHVGGSGDAAHADDGNFHGMGRVVDHAYGDRFDRGTGESGGNVRDARLARLGINGHGDECVDQRQGIGARLLRDVSHLRDAGHVGGELHDQRDAARHVWQS